MVDRLSSLSTESRLFSHICINRKSFFLVKNINILEIVLPSDPSSECKRTARFFVLVILTDLALIIFNWQRSPKYPDFKHKDTGEALWIEGRYNPPWVKSQLAILDSRMGHHHDQENGMHVNFMSSDEALPF